MAETRFYNLRIEAAARAQTAAFIVLSVSQLFHSFNCRSNTQSVFKLGFFTNMNLIFAFLASVSLQLAVVSFPVLQKIFKTEFLTAFDWLLVILLSSLPLW